jgi:site-specific recombinase XerD
MTGSNSVVAHRGVEALTARLVGYQVAEPVRIVEPGETWEALVERFDGWMRRRRYSPNTIRLRTGTVVQFARFCTVLGLDPLLASTDDLEDFVNSRAHWSDASRASAQAGVRMFYGWLQRAKLILEDPSRDMRAVRVNMSETRIASSEQIRAGLAAGTTAEKAMLLLGAECGLRVNEIATLTVDCREGEWLTVIGKGGRKRSVWLSPALRDLLDQLERQARHGYFFPGRSGHAMAPSTVWRHIRDITGTNPHSLRHRAGTTVYRELGNDLRAAQAFLGHASPITTARYVHVERVDLRRAGIAAAIGDRNGIG